MGRLVEAVGLTCVLACLGLVPNDNAILYWRLTPLGPNAILYWRLAPLSPNAILYWRLTPLGPNAILYWRLTPLGPNAILCAVNYAVVETPQNFHL